MNYKINSPRLIRGRSILVVRVVLDRRFYNLQRAALLASFLSSVQYDNILFKFGLQQLVMVNYVSGFNQSETTKYFE